MMFTDADVQEFAEVLADSIEQWVRSRRATIRTWEPAPMPDDYTPSATDFAHSTELG